MARHGVVLALLLACAAAQDPVQGEGGTKAMPDTKVAVDPAARARHLADVRKKLADDRPASVAWGGWLAQHHGLKETVPELRAALGVWSSAKVLDHYVLLALLDALVQLDADVPAAEIAPCLRDGRVPHIAPAIVLLARDPRSDDVLLELFDAPLHAGSTPWAIAGHLLAARKAKGFAARLLARLHARLCLEVVDSNGAALTDVVRPNVTAGCGWRPGFCPPSGFPPSAAYTWAASEAGLDWRVVVAEPRVCWKRQEIPWQWHVEEEPDREPPASPRLWRWLDRLDPGAGALRERTGRVRFTSAEGFAKQIERLRAEHGAKLGACVQRLVAAELLDRRDVAELPIDVSLIDLRTERHVKLPEIPGAKRCWPGGPQRPR